MDSSPPPAAPGAMPGQMGRRRFKAEGTALSGSTSGQWEISLGLKWLMIELWAIGTEEEDGLSFRAIARRLSSGARTIHHSTVRNTCKKWLEDDVVELRRARRREMVTNHGWLTISEMQTFKTLLDRNPDMFVTTELTDAVRILLDRESLHPGLCRSSPFSGAWSTALK